MSGLNLNLNGEGFVAYALYNALHLHFTSKSYDYFKYHGKTNVSKETFTRRKDKYYFHKLSRKYSLENLRDFYVANFIECGFNWVGDIIGEEGESNFLKWKKRRDSLTYTFQNDIDFLLSEVKNPNDLLSVKSGNYPKLLEVTLRSDIEIETTCILNDILNFLPMWNKKISDDIIFPHWSMKIEKYTPFITFSKPKFKQILKEKMEDSVE